jgi:hypothetical protein
MAALSAAIGLAAADARGDVAFQFPGTLTASGAGNDAFYFTTGNLDLLVTDLGEFNGTNEVHTVAIYQTDSTFAPRALVVSAQITTTATYDGFKYVDVSSSGAVLKANTKYYLIGNAGAGKQLVTGMSIGLGSGIASFDAYRWNWSAQPDPVTTNQSNSVYWGSNFKFVTIPAPSAPVALALAGIVVGVARKRR